MIRWFPNLNQDPWLRSGVKFSAERRRDEGGEL